MQKITTQQIRNELTGIRTVVLVDSVYGIVAADYLINTFTPWFIDWCRSSGLDYASEARDCDKFARAYASQAHFAAWRRQSQLPGAVGWMAVTDQGGHALNICRTEKGWVEIEPQNGKVTSLRDDRGSIIYVVL